MKKEALDALIREMIRMSDGRLDIGAFQESASFRSIVENQTLMTEYPKEDDPAVIAYWREKGLIKTLHGAGTGRQYDKWASYVPVEWEEKKDARYPLLFVMHGANNPIYLAESYGYTNIAAREKLVAIIPEDETPGNMEKLFAYARENLPVDWTRVYMAGYSLGGYMTARHAFRWPERFAAVGVGGMLFANGWAAPHSQGGKVWEGEYITPEMVENAAKFRVPACITMGENEMIGLIPATKDAPEPKGPRPAEIGADGRPVKREGIDLSSRNKIATINNWRVMNGSFPVDEETVRERVSRSADITVEKLGFPFERTAVITREDRSYFVGESPDGEGRTFLEVIGCAKSPHWPSQMQTELTWEFLSRFALDPDTGKSYLR